MDTNKTDTINEMKKGMTGMMWEMRELLVKHFLERLKNDPSSLNSSDFSTIVKFLKDNEVNLQNMDQMDSEDMDEHLKNLFADGLPSFMKEDEEMWDELVHGGKEDNDESEEDETVNEDGESEDPDGEGEEVMIDFGGERPSFLDEDEETWKELVAERGEGAKREES